MFTKKLFRKVNSNNF